MIAVDVKILLQNARRVYATQVMELLRQNGLVEDFDEAMLEGIVDRVVV